MNNEIMSRYNKAYGALTDNYNAKMTNCMLSIERRWNSYLAYGRAIRIWHTRYMQEIETERGAR